MRCDQLFGVQHKGLSVAGKAALRGSGFTSSSWKDAEPQAEAVAQMTAAVLGMYTGVYTQREHK